MTTLFPEKKDYYIFAILLTIVSLFLVWQAYPGIFKYDDDIKMIRYFDADAFTLVNGFIELHNRPLHYPNGGAYPMMFYYLVDFLIHPILYFTGNDVRFIAGGLKVVLLISYVALCGIIMYISRTIFKTWLPGIITILLSSSKLEYQSPIYLIAYSFRPDIFESFTLFCAFFVLSAYLYYREIKYLLLGVIISAICFSVKFDGVFLIPIIIGIIYYSHKKGNIEFKVIKRFYKKFNYLTALIFFITIAFIITIGNFYLYKYTKISTGKTLYETYDAGFIFKLKFLIFIVAAIFLFAGLLVIILERKSVPTLTDNNTNSQRIYILLSPIFFVCSIYLVVFLVTNPYFIMHPRESSIFLLRFPILFLNRPTSGVYEFKLPISPVFIKLLIKYTGLYTGLLILFLGILAMVRLYRFDKKNLWCRSFFLIIYSYFFIKLIFLSLFMHHQGENFILSQLIIIYLTFGFSISYLLYRSWVRNLVPCFIFILLLPSLKEREMSSMIDIRDKDAIFDVADWLDKNVQTNKTVCARQFYCPLKYTPVTGNEYWDMVRPIEGEFSKKIKEFSCDYLIIPDFYLSRIDNATQSKLYDGYVVETRIKNRAYPFTPCMSEFIIVFKKALN